MGGVVSDAIQLAAVRRSIEQVKVLLSQVGGRPTRGGPGVALPSLVLCCGGCRAAGLPTRRNCCRAHVLATDDPGPAPCLQVQASLAWAQQNLGAHQQRDAALQAQVAGKRAEVEAYRTQALATAAAAV